MPTVNTLIVDRADMLGLAQLYQLRGRVGRRGSRAYAYLLYPSDHKLSEEAYERLKTIGEFTDLGSGFKIAMRDLEIRGAGSLLGAEQSGHIAAVGFDLYVEMVTEAVGELTDAPPDAPDVVQIDLPVTAHLPRDYIARDDVRMEAYRRLAAVTSAQDVEDVLAEWTDRYGPPPPPAVMLLDVRAIASGVSAARHPRGLGSEGPGATRRLGIAEVAGGALATAVGSKPGACRRRDRAGRGHRRRVSPPGAAQVAARDLTARVCTLHRMKRPLAFLVAPVAVALVLSGCGSTLSDAATISFPVKNDEQVVHVTRADLLDEVGNIVKNKPFAKWLKENKFAVNSDLSTDSKVSAIWLSTLIRQQAIDQLFKARKLKVTAAQRAQAAKDVVNTFPTPEIYPGFDSKFRDTLIDRQARSERVFESYSDTSEAAAKDFYEANKDKFACASGKNVAHILVTSQAAAQDVLNQVKGGASFATLAQAKSTDTGSAPQGGLLGCLAPKEFVPEFQAAADAAPFDTAIGPIKTQYGYHVILVTHAKTTYDAVRTQVQQALAQNSQLAAQTAIDKLLKSFKVHLDSRFGTWGAVTDSQGQQRYQVTAPDAPNPSTKREGTTPSTTVAPSSSAPGTP